MPVIRVKSNVRDYSVTVAGDNAFLKTLSQLPNVIFVVDSSVWELHSGGCLKDIADKDIVVFSVHEERKNLNSVQELYDRFMERSAKKNMTMISIGGGILQDITGFTATTLYRGINWIFIPTTLLAQADSCIGSKTSLNYKRFKNLVGTFYPPSEVYIHTPFLKTLKDVDFMSGLGEVVKLHIMGGEKTARDLFGEFPFVLNRDSDALMRVVQRSLAIKLSYMEGDEFDQGRRNLLNFGHCFGHALETASNYTIPHGQAVVIGMIFSNIAARQRGFLSPTLEEYLLKELLRPSIATKGKAEDYAFAPILEAMKKDKKRTGQGLVVVLMRDDYSFEKAIDFSEAELRTALDNLTTVMDVR